ncbi:hypothetical protein I6H87_32910 (plasmid) [Cupriavidus necator]|nr:hypothetical protein I6H87_32910 [Cupriavidus necator]
MGAQRLQLTSARLQFRAARFEPGLRRRVRLPLRGQVRLHGAVRLARLGQLRRDGRDLFPRDREGRPGFEISEASDILGIPANPLSWPEAHKAYDEAQLRLSPPR